MQIKMLVRVINKVYLKKTHSYFQNFAKNVVIANKKKNTINLLAKAILKRSFC